MPPTSFSDTVHIQAQDVQHVPAKVPFAPDLHQCSHLRLKAVLLMVWLGVTFGVGYFAYDLQMLVGGWPLGYWVAAQGAVLVFLAIVVLYCCAMARLERQNSDCSAHP